MLLDDLRSRISCDLRTSLLANLLAYGAESLRAPNEVIEENWFDGSGFAAAFG